MQYSKYICDLRRIYGLEPKDVFFALLVASGAQSYEAYTAVIKASSASPQSLKSTSAQYIDQRPSLRKLIQDLNNGIRTPDNKKPQNETTATETHKPKTHANKIESSYIDYSEKDAVLRELSRIVERSETKDQIQALKAIADINRLKQEQNKAEEKRVIYYIPLGYRYADELLVLLQKYYENPNKLESENV